MTPEQQCEANIRAVLASEGLHIASAVLESPKPQQDRTYFAKDELLLECLHLHVNFREQPAFAVSRHGKTAIRGWRELETVCSCQIIEHEEFIEIDIDLGGVKTDTVGIFVHAWEVISNRVLKRKTDPFKVRDWLAKYRDVRVEEVAGP